MPDPMIVILPDTQYLVEGYPDVWRSMCQWVADNKVSSNIIAVGHTGDVIDDGPFNDAEAARQFVEGKYGLDIIDTTGLPYIVAQGNHDFNTASKMQDQWVATFPLSRYSGKSWYGGAMATTTDNMFIKFTTAEGYRFLFITLKMASDSTNFTWAQGIIDANPEYNVAIFTHAYLNSYGSIGGADYNGWALWDGLIKLNPRIFAVFSAHYHDGGIISKVVSPNNNGGNPVNQIMYCNQLADIAGNTGYLVLVTIGATELDLKFYSPWLDDYDVSEAYTLSWSNRDLEARLIAS